MKSIKCKVELVRSVIPFFSACDFALFKILCYNFTEIKMNGTGRFYVNSGKRSAFLTTFSYILNHSFPSIHLKITVKIKDNVSTGEE